MAEWPGLPTGFKLPLVDEGTDRLPDPTMEAIASSPELSATIGSVPITSFGASPGASAAVNTAAISAAFASASTFGLSVRIPALEDGEFFDINDVLIPPAGIEVFGYGPASRVRQTVKPKTIFRVKHRVHIHDLAVWGMPDRTIPTGAWVRDTREAQLYSGVVCQAGSDGSVIENIYGARVVSVVHANAYSDAAGDYAGTNIQGLTIRHIEGDDVWGGVHVREVDNLVVDDVVALYSPPGGYTAPPHALYTAFVGTEGSVPFRPIRNAKISNVRGKAGSTGGHAASIKALRGSTVSGITADGCTGVLETLDIERVKFESITSTNDVYAGDRASLAIKAVDCEFYNVTVQFAEGDHTFAFKFETDTEGCSVDYLTVIANHATENLGSGFAEVWDSGVNNSIANVRVVNLGETWNAAVKLQNCTGSVLRGMDVLAGYKRGLEVFGTVTGTIEFDPARVRVEAVTGAKPLAILDGAAVKVIRPRATYDDDTDVVAWDIGDQTGNLNAAVQRWSSGHQLTISVGTWVYDGDQVQNSSNHSNSHVTADLGVANIDYEQSVLLGESSSRAGIAFRTVDAGNTLAAYLTPTGVVVGSRVGGAGGAPTVIQSWARTLPVGRYRLRVVVRGDQVRVFLDGEFVGAVTLDSTVMATFGAATRFGYYVGNAVNSRFGWARLRRA